MSKKKEKETAAQRNEKNLAQAAKRIKSALKKNGFRIKSYKKTKFDKPKSILFINNDTCALDHLGIEVNVVKKHERDVKNKHLYARNAIGYTIVKVNNTTVSDHKISVVGRSICSVTDQFDPLRGEVQALAHAAKLLKVEV